MASIRKKNEKWQVQIRRKGLSAISRTFLTKSDALQWSRQIEAQLDRHDLPPKTAILDATTLANLVDRYLVEVVPEKRSASVETIILKAFLRHKICRKSLSAITFQDWNAYRDERLRTISAKSLKRQLSPLRHMFSVAASEWDLPIASNPITKIKLKADIQSRARRLSEVEESALKIAASLSGSEYLPGIIEFALETGMRRGEILAMKYHDFDFGTRTLKIPVTKNGEARTIPMTKTAIDIARRRRGMVPDGASRVFQVSADALRHAFSRACVRACVENLHFHDLRHEAISRFFEMGLTTPEVALISGHKDVRMLFRYAHGTQKAILAKFDSPT